MKLHLIQYNVVLVERRQTQRVLKGRHYKKVPRGDLPSTGQAKDRNVENVSFAAILQNSFSRLQCHQPLVLKASFQTETINIYIEAAPSVVFTEPKQTDAYTFGCLATGRVFQLQQNLLVQYIRHSKHDQENQGGGIRELMTKISFNRCLKQYVELLN